VVPHHHLDLPPLNQVRSGVRKRYTAEKIIEQLRTIEIELGKGLAVVDAGRKLGITEQTYYRWKKEYGRLRVGQAKWLKGLEQENARLKRLVADLSLDNSILKEVAAGNF
jgi:transposase-like protein